jgi:hypothetical protein
MWLCPVDAESKVTCSVARTRATCVATACADGDREWFARQTNSTRRGCGMTAIQAVGVKRRNRRLLLTTKTLDDAMAALATMGESSHDIASGIAATL